MKSIAAAEIKIENDYWEGTGFGDRFLLWKDNVTKPPDLPMVIEDEWLFTHIKSRYGRTRDRAIGFYIGNRGCLCGPPFVCACHYFPVFICAWIFGRDHCAARMERYRRLQTAGASAARLFDQRRKHGQHGEPIFSNQAQTGTRFVFAGRQSGETACTVYNCLCKKK